MMLMISRIYTAIYRGQDGQEEGQHRWHEGWAGLTNPVLAPLARVLEWALTSLALAL